MLLIGHRGAPMLAQENTIESFTIAFAAGVKGIELDVQLSKDGLLVVFHDWNLENLTGSLIPIKDMDYSEIRDFSNKNNYKIPLLGEVLEICPKNMVINIEIKSLDYSNTLIVEKVVNMIETYKIKKTVVVSSFNPFVLKVAKKICPELPTAYLWSSEDVSFLINSPLWIWLCRPDGFHIDINNANEKNISWARKNNLAVLVFAVNNSFDLSKALELRVDGIFTDNPYLKLSSTLS
jgi:glycerophosphoryl diester phosphodiesterase